MHDHRKLGRELELFDTDPLVGAGLPYWLPAGAVERISETVRKVKGVVDVRRVRARQVGPTLFVDLDVAASRTLPRRSRPWSVRPRSAAAFSTVPMPMARAATRS